jgi:hypothetical protein
VEQVKARGPMVESGLGFFMASPIESFNVGFLPRPILNLANLVGWIGGVASSAETVRATNVLIDSALVRKRLAPAAPTILIQKLAVHCISHRAALSTPPAIRA